jgi:hypothetical protein
MSNSFNFCVATPAVSSTTWFVEDIVEGVRIDSIVGIVVGGGDVGNGSGVVSAVANSSTWLELARLHADNRHANRRRTKRDLRRIKIS